MIDPPRRFTFTQPVTWELLSHVEGRRRMREIARVSRELCLERLGLSMVIAWSNFRPERVYKSDLYDLDGEPDGPLSLRLSSDCWVVPG